jgi:hypothetical protein
MARGEATKQSIDLDQAWIASLAMTAVYCAATFGLP